MADTIYEGTSEGVKSLVDGYIEYGKSVIIARAIPDLRDGQKVVNRRILYSLKLAKADMMTKSGTVVGVALGIHPHGDSSVYQAMCLMTDENESCNVPYVCGMGNLGKVYSNGKPAQMRYTKVKKSPFYNDLFKDDEVMKMIPSEEGDGFEPEVLNAIYPVVLVNGAQGIAVSAGTMLPSFNLIEVLDLTLKYIKTGGKLTYDDMIAPDFSSGGVLVGNKEEIAKIMTTGKGRLKVRAKVEIVGASILVKEVPVGKTAEGIVKAISEAGYDGIKSVFDTQGRNSQAHVTIVCKSKRVVESVLMQLYSAGILQSTFASNILVINGKDPKILGVYDIIGEWYKWRKEVLAEKFNKALDSVKEEGRLLRVLMKLINDKPLKDEFVRLATSEGKAPAIDYLAKNLKGATREDCSWIHDRGLGVFHRGGSYAQRLDNIEKSERSWKGYLSDLDGYIIDELSTLRRERAGMFPRKTLVTNKDYKFSKIVVNEEVVDETDCVFTLMKSGFLTKGRVVVEGDDVIRSIKAKANSILIGFDNYGRILRVVGSEIPYTSSGDVGVYLPRYFGCENLVEQFGYKVLYLCLLDGSKKTLIYRDGFIGTFDTSEHLGKKNTKVIANGVCRAVRDKLVAVYEEGEIPDYLLFADDSGRNLKLGVVVMGDVREAGRTSRAKVLGGSDINAIYMKDFRGMELVKYISNPDDYIGKLKVFHGEFLGDPGELETGFYYDLCPDIVNQG